MTLEILPLIISNLAAMSLMKSYAILQNAGFIAFTVSELLRENQQGVKKPPTTQTKVKY